MTKQVQRRRGTATQHTSFTGAEGELSVNTTNKSVHVHDNVTAGGFEAARVDMDNVTSSSILTAAGITATTTELNYVDGVTSAIQTQINGKAGTASPTFTGTLTTANLTATGTTTLAGASTSADITFGDNDKAIFGAGSDLSIFHNGSSSLIEDSGTGGLTIRSNLLTVQNAAGNETVAQFVEDGFVKLFHNNSQVLTTTATGIDVTGTITSDALTVDGVADVNANNINYTGSSPKINIYENDITDLNTQLIQTGGDFLVRTLSDNALSADARIRVDHSTGDISFYEDTGTTPKFFWDASVERLGLGTSTPRTGLHLYGAGQTTSAISDSGSLGAFLRVSDTGGAGGAGGGVVFGTNASEADGFAGFAAIKGLLSNGNDRTIGALAFSMRASTTDTALTERMRLTSDGKLGIGVTPSEALHVHEASTNASRMRISNTDGYLEIGTNNQVSNLDSQTHTFRNEAGSTEYMRIDSSGNVGIGTTADQQSSAVNEGIWLSPGSNSSFSANSTPLIINRMGTGGNDRANITLHNNGTARADIGALGASNGMYVAVGGSEAMRIDASGNLLVGKTTTASDPQTGMVLQADGIFKSTSDGSRAGNFNRGTSDGEIVRFAKDGSTVGQISGYSGDLVIGTSDTGLFFNNTSNHIKPANASTGANRDNAIDLGSSGSRWAVVRAGTGSINTSDRNEKQDIEELSDAEQRVAVACKSLIRKFKFNDAVEAKGNDARIHVGIIAQDLQAAFASEGLDASRYAMFCSDTWWETQTEVPAIEAVAEVLDDDGNVVTEAVEAVDAYTRTDTYDTQEEAPEGATERTRLGVRYSELLAFIIAAI